MTQKRITIRSNVDTVRYWCLSQHQDENAKELQTYTLKIGETLFGNDAAQLQEIRDMM